MKKVDLHIHTNASDGTWSVDELLEEIKKKDIKIFSITDHDTVQNIKKMESIIKPKEIKFVPGVEISTSYEGREYHLTIYNYDIENEEINNLVKWNLATRLDYNMEFISYMSKLNKNISKKDYIKYTNDVNRGGWKSLNYMIDNKIHKNMQEHFIDVSKSGLKLIFKSPEEVIKICKKSGGKVFLAHPAYYKKVGVIEKEKLDFWIENGIDGIECFSPYTTNKNQVDYYINYCKNNNLMISGGSDCHGLFIPERQLGKPEVFEKDLDIKGLL